MDTPDIFACSVTGCGFRGKTSKAFREHTRAHEEGRIIKKRAPPNTLFQCQQCSFCGTSSGSLQKHVKKRHDDSILERNKTKPGPVQLTAPMPEAFDRRSMLLQWSETLPTISVVPEAYVVPPNKASKPCSAVVYPKEEPHPFVVRECEVGEPMDCDVRGCDFWCLSQEAFLAHQQFHSEQFANADEGGDPDTPEEPLLSNTSPNRAMMKDNDHPPKDNKPSICAWDYRTKEYPYVCGFAECRRGFKTASSLMCHYRTHFFSVVCDFPGCGYRCGIPSALKSHSKTHSKKGQLRRKKQENRLMKKLEEWGYRPDVEVTIDAKRGGCVQDTEHRYFSRLDFVILECVSHVVIIECDEHQHSSYLLPCELSRMTDVQAALVLAGYNLPVHWIRYSPNGKYTVGGIERFPKRGDREVELKSYIDSLCAGEVLPSGQMSFHFMFYDRFCDGGPPCIVSEPEFPGHLKKFVTCF